MKKTAIQHSISIGILLLIAFAFSYPTLQGNKLAAGDTIHWMGMSQEARSWYQKTGENPMWSNSMFGGMPTVTHYMRGKNNLIYPIQEFLTDTLPSPVFFLLIAMICFYILMVSWNVNSWIAIFGAVAYAFASYNLQIIGAGHNTKMLSIAYMPLVLAGMNWVYHQKYLIGAGAALVGLSLMISNAMYQIDYYLLLILLAVGVGYFILDLSQKNLKQFFISSAIMLSVGLVSIGPSLDSLLLTKEYTTQTMRGGKSELTIGKTDNKKDGGLDKDYAFMFSQGIGETFTLLVPNLYGGGARTNVGTGSATYKAVMDLGAGEDNAEQISKNANTYWGPQPYGFLAGPIYFGAILIFLFVLSFFIIKNKIKWAFIAIAIIGMMMSWGKNLPFFNYFLFDNLPMYNKFRTPSMAIVIPGLAICLLAFWAMQKYFSDVLQNEQRLEALKKSFIITAGLCLLIGIGGIMFLDFKGPFDSELKQSLIQMTGGNEQAGSKLFSAIVSDRSSLVLKDGIRSFVYITLAASVMWLFLKQKIKKEIAIILVGLLISIDLISIGTRYLNSDDYVSTEIYDEQFAPRPVDVQINQDTSYYRVYDLTRNPYNDAMGAYHHKLVGGYHPAKMEAYQDLIDNQLSPGKNLNAEVLNMLNTKYFIFDAGGGKPVVQQNPNACGNAWFVNKVKVVENADQEMLSLNAENLGDTAQIANPFRPKEEAVVQQKYWNSTTVNYDKDSSSHISLTQYGLNDLSFESNNAHDGFAVFADIYYPYGWKAYIDGKEAPIVKTDYVLRGLNIPAGKHKIKFEFRPQTYLKWGKVSLVSSILILLVLIGGIGLNIKNEMKN
ncbi:MAG TPA: YfhO family protein [Chitinophagaceae bacterium]|nr:YfhO family protein [Chitinophagaceae bacterium]